MNKGLSRKTIELIEFVLLLLRRDHPMTLRQLHYAIFSAAVISYFNDQAHYKRLSRVTTLARRAYREWELGPNSEAYSEPACSIPTGWIVDETRQEERVTVWQNARQYLEDTKTDYRRDIWADQPQHVEIWSEKATILGSIRPICYEWGVTRQVTHGFGSCGMESRIGEYFASLKKPITVFYLGDHDPSGRLIETDMHKRVETAAGIHFKMRRLAIHLGDIKRFNLPPQRIKATDTRATGFKARYGDSAATVELDALPVQELRRRVESAITGVLDWDRWHRQIRVQDAELTCIAEFVDTVKNLPQVKP